MFFHQGTDILVTSIDAVTNITNLETTSNVQLPAHSIAAIPAKLTCKCITATPCILEMEIDEIVNIQNPQLVMLPTVHLKDVVEPAQVLLTCINLSYDAILITKHTVRELFSYMLTIRNSRILRYTT